MAHCSVPGTDRELSWPTIHIVGRPDTGGTVGKAEARKVQPWDGPDVAGAPVINSRARGQLDLSPCQFQSSGRGRTRYLFLERHLAYKGACLCVGVFPVTGSRPLGYAVVSFRPRYRRGTTVTHGKGRREATGHRSACQR